MSDVSNSTDGPIDLAQLAVEAATLDHGGSTSVAQWSDQFRAATFKQMSATTSALAAAQEVLKDKYTPDVGRLEQLEIIEQRLVRESMALTDATASLEVLTNTAAEAVLLDRDHSHDAELREEIALYMARGDGMTLVQLAANVRYSAILADAYGAAMAAKYNHDPASLRRAALQALGVAGTAEQRRLSAAKASNAANTYRARLLAKTHTDEAIKTVHPNAGRDSDADAAQGR